MGQIPHERIVFIPDVNIDRRRINGSSCPPLRQGPRSRGYGPPQLAIGGEISSMTVAAPPAAPASLTVKHSVAARAPPTEGR